MTTLLLTRRPWSQRKLTELTIHFPVSIALPNARSQSTMFLCFISFFLYEPFLRYSPVFILLLPLFYCCLLNECFLVHWKSCLKDVIVESIAFFNLISLCGQNDVRDLHSEHAVVNAMVEPSSFNYKEQAIFSEYRSLHLMGILSLLPFSCVRCPPS